MKKLNALILALAISGFPAPGMAAASEALRGVAPLQDNELGQLCGGFSLPGGMNLNVGIDNQVSLNGLVIATSTFALNGMSVNAGSSGTTQVQSSTGTTTVQMSPTGSAVITNSASNVAIAQARNITLNLSGMVKPGAPSFGNLVTLQTQAISAFKNGIH